MPSDSEGSNPTGPEVEWIPLAGSILPKPRGVQEIGPLDLSRRLPIAIHLRTNVELPTPRQSTATASDESDRMSLEDFELHFGSSQEDVDAVVKYLRSLGVKKKCIETTPGHCLIEVEATVEQCNTAFGVELELYDSRRGKFFGHDDEVRIPKHLEGIIEAVSGLDNLVTLSRVRAEETVADLQPDAPEVEAQEDHPSEADVEPAFEQEEVDVDEDAGQRGKRGRIRRERLARSIDTRSSEIVRSVQRVSKPDHRRDYTAADKLIPPDYRLYFPSDLARLYQFPEGYDGSGETIAIVSLDGHFDRPDIVRYFEAQQIRIPQIDVVTVGPQRPRSNKPTMHDLELTMDLQVAGSVAPGAKLVVYRVGQGTPQPYLTALKQALHSKHHRPSVVSISYGCAEGLFRPRDLEISNKYFEAATRMGITICAASGDAGSASRDHDSMPPPPGTHVNFPASSPFVLACGGTAIEESDGELQREFAWNDHNQCRLATAGGISRVFKRPEYQRPLTLPKNKSDRRGFDGRGVPDVAANASLTSGYRVLFQGEWFPNGGTSAATPLWAGLIARLNQALGRRLGFIHPYIYRMAGTPAMRDITEGSNGFYKAARGWDACTGNGTPVGQVMLEMLARELGVTLKDPDEAEKPGDNIEPNGPNPPNDSTPTPDLATAVASANQSASLALYAARLARSAVPPHF